VIDEPFGVEITAAVVSVWVRQDLILMVNLMSVAKPRVSGGMLGPAEVLSVAAQCHVLSFDDLTGAKL